MGYDLITVENCLKIDSLIKETSLSKPIELAIPVMDLILCIDAVASIEESSGFEGQVYDYMKKRCFTCKGSSKVLKVKNREYGLCFNLGSWPTNMRIDDSHLVMASTYSALGRYFCQLEFSQALEDQENIYIVKNISKLAGEGAITRLNKGAASKEEKYKRRDELAGRLNKEVIDYDDQKWLCIDWINKNDLNNVDKWVDIFDRLMLNLMKFAFTIEDIVNSNKKN